ncbi:MAG: GH92 family glycosyl hydrolase [Tannerellaceae bacterium]|nr:GH92 family glycosyl hydrolase [Tannerellaceae bacterium]
MEKQLYLLCFLFIFCSCNPSEDTINGKEPAGYVNPFIGASTNTEAAGAYHGLGKTFPGATTPFGMVQLSPNTITGGDNGSGYSYEHETIEGFAFTQMSGIGWYGDLGNFLVMPSNGELKTSAGKATAPETGYRSRYDKTSETASAGYYSVYLSDYAIRAEATVSPHAGILRFTFPEHEQSRIQIDLARRVGGTSTEQYIQVVNEQTIRGWMKCPPEGGGWGNGDGNADYTVYFYAEFSKPFTKYGVWSASLEKGQSRKREAIESDSYQEIIAGSAVIENISEYRGKHTGFFSEFETVENEEVLLKAGISFVDMEGAEKNLKEEIRDFDFDRVRKQSYDLWNNALNKIRIEEEDEDRKTIFYTSLYHTMIDPRCYTDVDGRYTGADKKIHTADNFTKRTIFSGWDVFRSQFPLQTIINPEVVNDMLNSLITMADQSGREYFERWELLNAYSGCMLGNPAISVLADAYTKGIRGYDVEKAYAYAVNTTDLFGNGERGYVADGLGISKTLEYGYTEWCLSELARQLGKKEDQEKYLRHSASYKNIYDAEKKSFRPRREDGSFEPWPETGRLTEWYGCIECNPYQQGWFVPHDVEGLALLMGGPEAALADLDHMFENTPTHFLWNDYYNHANEPVHHVPFLYNRLGEPWKTQYWSRFICENAYKNAVEGLTGNEDVGQMSAWYVLSSIGLHPVCPGETRLEITTPLFTKTAIRTGSGNTFTIIARNNSPENLYIQSASLNGQNLQECFIDYTDVMKGGVLELELGKLPNKSWGL